MQPAKHPTRVDHREDRLEVDLLLRTLVDGRWIVAAVALLVFAASSYQTLLAPMTFTASASLYVGEISDYSFGGPNAAFDFLGTEARSKLGTEIQIIGSRSLACRAIERVGLNARIEEKGTDPVRFWKWLTSGRDLELLQRPIVIRDASVEEQPTPLNLEVRFTADNVFDVYRDDAKAATGRLGDTIHIQGTSFRVDVPPKTSPPKAGRIFKVSLRPSEDVYGRIQGRLDITGHTDANRQQTNIISLEFTDGSPFASKEFVDELMRVYLEQHLRWKTEAAEATERFVSEQLGKLRESLDKSEQSLVDYKSSSGLVMTGEGAQAMIEQLGRYEEQQATLRVQLSSLEQIDTVLRKPDAPIEAYLFGDSGDSVLMEMSNSLTANLREIQKLSEQVTKDSPEVRERRALVENQRQMIQGYLSNRIDRVRQQMREVDKLVTEYQRKLGALPAAERELVALERSSQVVSRLYTFLLEKQEEAELTKASTILRSRILDEAPVPKTESGPSIVRWLASLLIGVAIGLAVVFVRFAFRARIEGDADVRHLLPEAHVVATIGRRSQNRGDGPIFTGERDTSYMEGFRMLRANLYYSHPGSCEVILVTSPGPGDGKSLTSLALASALAMDGKRVFLLDVDLHAGVQHKNCRVEITPGVTEILSRRASWRETVRVVDTGVAQLSMIPRGRPHPNASELLGQKELVELLLEARKDFDYIIIDSPPFPLMSDALTLSRLADRVLTVARAGHSVRRVLAEHYRRLDAVTKNHGLVLNDMRLGGGYGYGYGYGYRYRYGYRTQAERNEIAESPSEKSSNGRPEARS